LKSKAYFDLCTEKLAVLAYQVALRSGVNILDLNIHCEDFYARLLNLLFGYSLVNMNAAQQNAASIDLIDVDNKVILQVSSTATHAKIEGALMHARLAPYLGYRFRFVSISKDAGDLKKRKYKNPHRLLFSPKDDVIDLKSITGMILHGTPSKNQMIYSFLREELPQSEASSLTETNIAGLVKILGAEDLTLPAQTGAKIPFGVEEKIEFNNLETAADLIDRYSVYQPRIENIYADFDLAGKNKSTSVLGMFQSTYAKLKKPGKNGDDLFFEIVENVMDVAKNSTNYSPMLSEELEMCVQLLAVDAFLRCRIFKNPKVVKNVAA